MSFSLLGDWNAKVRSQETPGVTGKFGFGVQNEAGQRLTEFCQENTLVIAKTFLQQHSSKALILQHLALWSNSHIHTCTS